MTVSPTPTGSSVHAGGVAQPPDPELGERARRRRFSADYRMRIVREADACTEPGQIGALLRREGLYSSHLVDWRRRRDLAVLHALEAQKRGPKGRSQSDAEIAELRKRIARLERDLSKAHTVIDIQGKVSALLRSELESAESDEQ